MSTVSPPPARRGPGAGLLRWFRLRAARRRSLAFCAIATREFLPWALTLFDSLRRHHPAASLVLLYVPKNGEPSHVPVFEGARVLSPADLVDPETERSTRRRYGIAEFCFALKPALMRHALDHIAERVIYLDTDIDVVGPLDEALIALEGSPIVLTPHLDAPLPPDGKRPSDVTILRAGVCNAGFAAVGHSEEARLMLAWWWRRVMQWGFVAPERGYQGDQKWLDMAVALFPGTELLRDPGSNLAYWNLHSRRLARDGRGLTANGAPVSFVHFSGFDPGRPAALSRFQDRVVEADQPLLMELAADFAKRVIGARERAQCLQWRDAPSAEAPATGLATASAGAMPDAAYRARIEVVTVNDRVETGEEVVARLRITNASPELWRVAAGPAGDGGIAASFHVRDHRREILFWDNDRFALPRDLAPGESVDVVVVARAPWEPGRYFLEFDLVHEGVGWFGHRGSHLPLAEIHVGGLFDPED